MTLDDGMTVAFGFFALGVLHLFVSQMLLLTVNWIRRLVG